MMPPVPPPLRTGPRALVLGDTRQSVTVVRSLARAGLEVIFGTHDAASSTALSRYVSRVWVYHDASGAQFRAHLEAFLRRERPTYTFPVGETPLRRMAFAADRFLPLSRWAMPDPETALLCLDKRALYRVTSELGIPTLPWEHYAGPDVWRSRAREMGFPVVVKRKDSALRVGGKKALIFHSAEAFEAFLDRVRGDPDPDSLLLQKFATGARHNCHVAAQNGKLIAYFEQKVLRTDELNHTGLGVEGVSVLPSAELRAHCERLLARLGYNGIGCIQFLVDERTGSAGFLELNPRMDSTAALPYRLGLDFPLLALQLAMPEGERPAYVPKPYPAGKRYHWLYGDLVHWQECFRRGKQPVIGLARWALAMLRSSFSSYHLTWDCADPLPTLHMYWRRARESFGRRLPGVRMKSRRLAK